jgi:Gpi18-like mannosyltransferase
MYIDRRSTRGNRKNELHMALRDRCCELLSRRPQWLLNVLLFLVLSRGLLNIPALVGANWFPLAEGIAGRGSLADPRTLPGVWARWDAGYYLGIAINGYSFHGEELAFFPAYPFLIRLFAVGQLSLVVWSGFLVSNLAFILAAILLWHQVRLDFSESIAWGTVITLSVFPTSFFFSAIYTESLFLLFSVLVYRFSARRQYALAGLFVSAASLTRINGLLLGLVPLIEILRNRPSRSSVQVVVAGFSSGAGLGLYGLYLWITQASPLAFVLAMSNWTRAIVWPWQTVFDSLAVAVCGYGGFRDNWFMRVTSAEDLLSALLFIGCTILAFFLVRRSLFAYSVATMLLFLISHGPYTLGLCSISRYVLGLFPGFIVLGILLDRVPRLKWGAWAIWLVILFFLTGWFASGRWVA